MSNIRPSNLPIEETDLIGFVHTDRGIDGSAKFNLANVSSALNLDGMATQAPSNVAITGGTITGITDLAVADGGTGASTLTGYVKGTGTAALTASATIPNTDITGLGTMSTQDAATVNIDGGAIDGTTIGATTPSTIAGTTGAFTSDTAGTILGVRNSAAGATKYTRFSLGNDSSATIAELYTFSSTYTPSAWEKPSGMGVVSSGSGGLSLVSQSGDVRILAGSLSTVHGLFTSTGLNSTAIGATTPSTGAFTTGTFSGVSGSNILTLTGADTNGNADMEIRSTGTAGNSRLFFGDTAGQTGSLIFSHASNSFALNQSLAVTGALSSTGAQSMMSGASTVSRSEYQGATSVAGSATSILPTGLGYGALCIVNGYQSGNQFADVVAVAGTTATALFSGTVSGSPAARTYTVVSNVLKLSMASGTYSVTAKQESLNAL